MTDRVKKLPLLPNFKEQLIRLFQGAGPAWMFAALVILMLPTILFSASFAIEAVAKLVRALH